MPLHVYITKTGKVLSGTSELSLAGVETGPDWSGDQADIDAGELLASGIAYDPTISSLSSLTVQDALDELAP